MKGSPLPRRAGSATGVRRQLVGATVAVATVLTLTSVAHGQTLAPLDARKPITYFIAPVPAGFDKGDRELAQWAVDAWSRVSAGALTFRPAPEGQALVRLYWESANGSAFGEMRAIDVGGERGAAVYVRPVDGGLDSRIATMVVSDRLFRDSILYLTCLHELGHALGLTHTREFADIMYSFSFGGDIRGYFWRYRRSLSRRTDIRRRSGTSEHDRQRLRALYRRNAPRRHR